MQFHVDNIMSSHINEKVNYQFLEWLNMKYGEHAEVTATRGNEHKHLGMKYVFQDRKFMVDITGKVK